MKRLPLSHGLFTLIDDEDFERCSQFRWYVSKGYVMRNVRKGEVSKTTQSLSRFIMNAPEGLDVDHIHGILLDNRKSQLRLCTRQQNNFNRGKSPTNTSGFKGVSWNKGASKWRAKIWINEKQIHLGYFTDLHDAAAAYKAAANKYHGEFART